MNKIRILIADDHAVVRMGLSALFSAKPDLEVVGQAKNGAIAVNEAARTKPDVLILDLLMPKKDGVEVTREVRAACPQTRILILTSYATSDGISRALSAGANGAIMKSAENAELIAAIHAVAAGKTYVSSEIRNLLATDPPVSSLTGRQTEVLDALTRGLTNKDIATQLGISVRSVEEHVNHLLEKIGASNRAEAVGIALRKHLLKI